MIADHGRTDAYRRAIEAVVQEGMTVLDVGTGTGILALFAARAGARHVWAVDDSSIMDAAREIARANGLDQRITFLRGRAEQVDLDSRVDLLVSEWMGFFALAECMFLSVVAARDRHLAEGGRVMPSRLRLCLAAVEDTVLYVEHGSGLWERPVFGFDFTSMVDCELRNLITTSVVLPASALLGPPGVVLDLDCVHARAQDFFFDGRVELEFERDGVLHGLGGWFEVDLAPGVTLSTSPLERPTHWRQSFFPVRAFPVRRGDRLTLEMKAQEKEFGDQRLPLYFTDGWLRRADEEVHRFFYCHQGSFE